MSPTNPIIPENATMAPVIRAQAMNTFTRTRVALRPSVTAVSSPMLMAFSAPDCRQIQRALGSKMPAGHQSWSHWASPRLPSIQ